KFRIVGGNSGIQYRSKEVDKWVIAGYQADFDGDGNWTGTLYEEKGRGILAKRGNKVAISPEGKAEVVGQTTPEAEILASYKKGEWNDYTIIAQGNHLIQKVNGLVTVDVTDNQNEKAAESGLLALQLHAGPPMTVQFKDIRLKRLGEKRGDSAQADSSGEKKKVVFVAGRRSHGYGAHEHYAGCVLLAKELESAMPNLETEVYRNGWPEEAGAFDGADCIVMYADGGGGHPVIPHREEVDKLAKNGVGIVCIHYAVEIPKDRGGEEFLDLIGGYFEAHWSVNPHWTANFQTLPEHPITRGVEPFAINDEWYYHMRFREGMEGVTPILTDHPPKETLSRPDGAHSGNPAVREAIAKGQPQHVAWAAEREDGGRGFGFTGGHNHWNWGDPNFRKLVLNAIAWCARADVPEEGIQAKPLAVAELEKNQDFEQPANFNREDIRKRLNLPADGEPSQKPEKKTTERSRKVKPAFESEVITTKTPGHAVEVETDIAGAEQLYLVVTDGGNGFACDWADWAEPRLVTADGKKKRLTEIPWKYAGTDWGQVRVNANAEGRPLRIDGKPVEYGIGAHANSLIVYDLPPGFVKFRARAGLDNGGTDQDGGNATSVAFAVYTQKPPQAALRGSSGGSAPGSHDPEDAVAALDVADGLEATLFAAEPDILSLTNLDVDHRGRVWVCEVVNYRRHDGRRPEGDRILILEDTDGDGRCDKTKVYYQGRDIDSAMGICVLGNRVIISATPNIWVFTDEDGDDKPDGKEALFTKTGQPQHDHSAHSFLFGPDGKLYWNFGNTGRAVHDKNGEPVIDLFGNRVVDNGDPYFGGMIFRCDQDGTNFEVLAHNFRNNYETTVDSFGTLWQSDNDDDGNRGVRINYVMEYGNYGYREEMTGAGWKSPRTNLEEEIPLQHWHLNDPGVVPNLLQTGAGSPTGITVNEGDLLPGVFRNEVIHCDAGPNIVRAYPVEKDGAGYTAASVDILHGARDNWFRPADVCVAPDGSLFVTDWYDPGVGGHNMQDLERGRLFRIAPPGSEYKVPQFDFGAIKGCVAALKNPNYAVRYLAWEALQERGAEAEPALASMFESDENPRHRARALWLLGKIPGRGEEYVKRAIADKNSDIRIVGVRLARQLPIDVAQVVAALGNDPSPQVRRDCLVALHQNDSPRTPELWAELALRHDGEDRWYLEALGIGAAGQWDACLDAWLSEVGNDWNTPAGRDIIWRSRSSETPALLAKIIADPQTPRDELPRYFRAFDFLTGPESQAALSELAVAKIDDVVRQSLVSKETFSRLNADVVRINESLAKAVDAAAQRTRGTSDFVSLVEKFRLERYYPELLALARE
ncbi:MAG: NPCBM/NEW2 domain-containing protein, partial [Planctomycetes bacterium]|nr:NPCBM/NEW2 domain-containing protein [Planctomycetota bacterium]